MKFTLILEDEYGNRVNMTSRASDGYMTSEITGLDPPNATVATSTYATGNLSHYDNSYVAKRNIVIKFEMRGPYVEQRRQELYEVVKPASYIKVYYKTKRRDVYSEGYVETCTVSNFSEKVSGQISIVCPDPYWYELESTTITHNFGDTISTTGNFRFEAPNDEQPFVLGKSYDETHDDAYTVTGDSDYICVGVENSGEETGMFLTLSWDGITPHGAEQTKALFITNGEEQFQLAYTGGAVLFRGYSLEVNTVLGSRSVYLINPDDEEDRVNYMGCVQAGSQWLQLHHGFNMIEIDGSPLERNSSQDDYTHATVTLEFRIRYLGV